MAQNDLTPDADSNSGLNFEEEAENLGSSDYWKPEVGTNKITFHDNGTEETREYDSDDGQGTEVREVVVFQITTDDMDDEEGPKKWTVNKASSETSLYGQIVRVGAAKGGLVGEEITLIRQGTGTDTQYTINEAADL